MIRRYGARIRILGVQDVGETGGGGLRRPGCRRRGRLSGRSFSKNEPLEVVFADTRVAERIAGWLHAHEIRGAACVEAVRGAGGKFAQFAGLLVLDLLRDGFDQIHVFFELLQVEQGTETEAPEDG